MKHNYLHSRIGQFLISFFFFAFILEYYDSYSQQNTLGAPELLPLIWHNDRINAIDISPNGKYLITASDDFTLIVKDADTGASLMQLMGHSGKVIDVKFNTIDNATAYSIAEDNVLIVWDLINAEKKYSITIGEKILSFSIDGIGYRAACGTNSGLVLIDLQNGKVDKRLETLFFKLTGKIINNVAIDPKGEKVISTVYNKIKIWDYNSGRLIGEFKSPEPNLRQIQFSNNGTEIISIADDDKILFWQSDTFELRRKISSQDVIKGYCITKNDSLLASFSQSGKILLWDLFSGDTICTIQDPLDELEKLIFSPKAHLLYGSGYNSIKVYSTKHQALLDFWKTGSILDAKDESVMLSDSKLSPDNRFLATGTWGGEIIIWDLMDGMLKHRFKGHNSVIQRLDFNHDGDYLLSGSLDSTLYLWETSSGQNIWEKKFDDGSVTSVDINNQGNIAVCCIKDKIWLWDTSNGKLITSLRTATNLNILKFSQDDQHLICGAMDGLLIWNLRSGRIRYRKLFAGQSISSIIFSEDGTRMYTGNYKGRIAIWDTNSFHVLKSTRAHNGKILSLAINNQGNTLFSSGEDIIIKRWELPNLSFTKSYREHTNAIKALFISKDDKWLISSSEDGSQKIWDIDKNALVNTMMPVAQKGWLSFSPDGRFDTQSLENLSNVYWKFSSQPFTVYPMEILMKEYFTHKLQSSILSGENLPPINPIVSKNFTLPTVEIVEVHQIGNSDSVNVILKVTGKRTTKATQGTGVHDVKLLRDGQLINWFPRENEGFNSGIENWRKNTIVELDPITNSRELQFIARIPFKKDISTYEFSAYAFNKDKIKCQTSSKIYSLEFPIERKANRVVLLNIGIGDNQVNDLKLTYTPKDASLIKTYFTEIIGTSDIADKVESITLTSDYVSEFGTPNANSILPTRKNILNCFYALSGNYSGNDAAFNNKLHHDFSTPLTPDDMLIITYHGHGYSDAFGEYHLVPYDIERVGEEYQNSISSLELTSILSEIDAKRIFLIIDACYSASIIENPDFKPAPLGNQGLGQLSYDKGIPVLVASQKDQIANSLGNGFLTYLLIEEGIKKRMAFAESQISFTDLLEFAVTTSSVVADKIRKSTTETVQNPVLFNFGSFKHESIIITQK